MSCINVASYHCFHLHHPISYPLHHHHSHLLRETKKYITQRVSKNRTLLCTNTTSIAVPAFRHVGGCHDLIIVRNPFEELTRLCVVTMTECEVAGGAGNRGNEQEEHRRRGKKSAGRVVQEDHRGCCAVHGSRPPFFFTHLVFV